MNACIQAVKKVRMIGLGFTKKAHLEFPSPTDIAAIGSKLGRIVSISLHSVRILMRPWKFAVSHVNKRSSKVTIRDES